MDVVTASAGSYPRIGDGEQLQAIRKGWRAWEKGEINDLQLSALQEDFTRRALEEQQQAGVDLLTDGLIRWYDPVSHMARSMKGVEIKGLLRWFDTNTYFRQPWVVDRIAWNRQIVLHDYRYCREVVDLPVKPVLTGPYTLARSSLVKDGTYPDLKSLVLGYAQALSQEVTDLASIGASVIQIDEPAILQHPADIPILREALEVVASHRMNADIQLQTYFGDVTPVFDELVALPITFLGVDFSYSPGLVGRLAAKGSPIALALGLLDARSTRRDDPEKVLDILKRIVPKIEADLCILGPTTGLEYLPRDRAQRKLKDLAAIAEKFRAVAA